jgi:hypothetical protein
VPVNFGRPRAGCLRPVSTRRAAFTRSEQQDVDTTNGLARPNNSVVLTSLGAFRHGLLGDPTLDAQLALAPADSSVIGPSRVWGAV